MRGDDAVDALLDARRRAGGEQQREERD